MLQGERGHRQHGQAIGVDQERVLVGAVVRASILDDPDPPRRNLVLDTMVELNDGIGDVFLETVARQGDLAAFARNDDREPAIAQPAEQPPQLRPEDRLVLQPGKERLDRVQDDALGLDGLDSMIETDEQALEAVLPGLFDLAAVDVDVVDHEAPLLDQPGQVEAKRSHVLGELLGVFFKAHQHARFVVERGAVDEEADAEQGLARAGPAAHQRGATGGQPAVGDLVEAGNAGWRLAEGRPRGDGVSHGGPGCGIGRNGS